MHPAVHVPFAHLVPGVGPRGDEGRADQCVRQQPEIHPPAGTEVEPGGGGEEDQLRNARFGQLEEGYKIFSVITAKTRMIASGIGTMKIARSRQRSNLRCMKNSATSNAFQTARASSSSSLMLREIGSSKASATSATVSTNRYSQIST